MIGDKIHIEKYHLKIAELIVTHINENIKKSRVPYCISIAGESGSGKSVLATALKIELELKGIGCTIIQQDDYFILPPKTNEIQRRKNLNFVGASEVNLQLIDEHLQTIQNGATQIVKPLVIFNENRIEFEILDIESSKVIIIEGTYVSLLQNIDSRFFIDRDYTSTIESIRKRERDVVDDFLMEVLTIEHAIISEHKKLADIIIKEGLNVEFVR